MTPTITVTEEAKEFFARNPDSEALELLESGVGEYGEFMGASPFVDALEDPETGHEHVYVVVEISPEKGSMMRRHHDFMCGWRDRHPQEERGTIRFSYRYL